MKKTIAEKLKFIRNVRLAAKPEMQGISFKYKTVQFHLIDDTFEEIERKQDSFGDVKIYSERFSLPGYGIQNDILSGDEFQFEIIANIESKVSESEYYSDLEKIMDKISKKHDVEILIEPYDHRTQSEEKPLSPNMENAYNLHKIIYYTNEDGIFPKE